MIGVVIIALATVVAIFAYALIPDNSANANQMHLSMAGKSPGFEIEMLQLDQVMESERGFLSRLFYGEPKSIAEQPISEYKIIDGGIAYREYEGGAQGPEKILYLDEDPTEWAGNHIVQKKFVLGTDKFGRDVLSRLMLGTRVSFSVGLVAVLISLLLGVPVGAIAGYYGGKVDKVIMWFINVVWSIPTLLLVIAITLALGKGFWQVFVAVGFTMWVEVARVVRGQFLAIRQKEYVEAARVLGYSDLNIIFRQILPNAFAPLIIISAANFAAAILIESGLGFLGIGAQPPMPSWGSMIKDHYSYIIVDKAYLAIAPGLAIMFSVLAFMLLGNSLRDALDVRKA